MILLGLLAAELPACQQRDGEHAQRQGRDREARLQRVVLEHHLQEDRERDHQPAQGDLLEGLGRDPEAEVLRFEEDRVDQRRLAFALPTDDPPRERSQRDQADGDQGGNGLAALLPDEDPEHDAAHADCGEDRADDVNLSRAGERNFPDEPGSDEHDRDDHDLPGECDPPREVGRDEAADQRPDRSGDRSGGADQRVGAPLSGPLEVAVDQRLHRRQEERRAEAADHGPEDDDREQALRQHHRERAGGVTDQADDERPLPADQIADLAADQDERRRDERLERDRRLDSARGRVQILDDGRDRHVHQRRVDDEDEHRHRQQDREQAAAARLFSGCRGRFHARRVCQVVRLALRRASTCTRSG